MSLVKIAWQYTPTRVHGHAEGAFPLPMKIAAARADTTKFPCGYTDEVWVNIKSQLDQSLYSKDYFYYSY